MGGEIIFKNSARTIKRSQLISSALGRGTGENSQMKTRLSRQTIQDKIKMGKSRFHEYCEKRRYFLGQCYYGKHLFYYASSRVVCY